MTLNPSANPPVCFPESIFDEYISVHTNHPWWVVRTKSRQEKALAWNLYAHGINYFLPLANRPQKIKTRVRISAIPLFSGYLFFLGDHLHRQEVLKTNRAAQIIEVPDQKSFFNELKNIHTLLLEEKDVKLCDFFHKGRLVTITHGPLKGLTGKVLKQKKSTYLQLSVHCIGQAVKVKISMEYVAPLL